MLSRLTVSTIPLFMSLSVVAAPPAVDDLTGLLSECAPGVDQAVMLPIVQHESQRYPYAIGLNSKTHQLPRQPSSFAEAVGTADWLLDQGFSFDSGLGQINSGNLPGLGLSTADLFDPCKNLQAASVIFQDCYRRAEGEGFAAGRPARDAALSCYNTNNFTTGFKNGYVGKVLAAAVTLDVPALSQNGAGKEPVKLTVAQPAPAQFTPPIRQEGIQDAFGSDDATAGAFSSATPAGAAHAD